MVGPDPFPILHQLTDALSQLFPAPWKQLTQRNHLLCLPIELKQYPFTTDQAADHADLHIVTPTLAVVSQNLSIGVAGEHREIPPLFKPWLLPLPQQREQIELTVAPTHMPHAIAERALLFRFLVPLIVESKQTATEVKALPVTVGDNHTAALILDIGEMMTADHSLL